MIRDIGSLCSEWALKPARLLHAAAHCVCVCVCAHGLNIFPKHLDACLPARLPASQAIKCTPRSIFHPELSPYASSQEHGGSRSAASRSCFFFLPQTVKNRSSCSYSGCPSATLCLFVGCKKKKRTVPFRSELGFKFKERASQ